MKRATALVLSLLSMVAAQPNSPGEYAETDKTVSRSGYSVPAPASPVFGQEMNRVVNAVSGDFDSDGVADLVAVDASQAFAFFKGNIDALFPNSPDAKKRREAGLQSYPFGAPRLSGSVALRPDFLFGGDFDADGCLDLIVGATGVDSFEFIPGDCGGGFGSPRLVAVNGVVTAVAAGSIGRNDLLADIVVAVENREGARLEVFEHPEGALRHPGQSFKLPGPATALAIGQLDLDPYGDVAAVSNDSLTVVHGRGNAYPGDLKPELNLRRPAAVVQSAKLGFRGVDIAVGRFTPGRGESLAILADDGRIEVWSPMREGVVRPDPKFTTEEISRTANLPMLPDGADSGPRRLFGKGAVDASSGDATGQIVGDLSEAERDAEKFIAERADRVRRQFESIDPKQRSQSAARAREADSRRQVALAARLAPSPIPLSRFEKIRFAADAALVNPAGRLIAGRFSASGLDDLALPVSGGVAILRNPKGATDPALGGRPDLVEIEAGAVVALRLNTDSMSDLICFGPTEGPSALLSMPSLTLTVTTTDDTEQGACDGSEPCSLRRALYFANANASGTTTINFNIPGAGVKTIRPATRLPDITSQVTIDGTTQPGFSGTPLIEIDGELLSGAMEGLKIKRSNVVVRGLAINNIPSVVVDASQVGGSAITVLSTTTFQNVTNVVIEGNFLGVDPTGSVRKPNDANGVHIFDADAITVGGTVPDARNVLSGNGNQSENKLGVGLAVTGGNSNLIRGNYIGTNALGNAKVGNSYGVFFTGINNEFGGVAAGTSNVVSGNGSDPNEFGQCRGAGLVIDGLIELASGTLATSDNIVAGNRFGTTASGTGPLGNCSAGVSSLGNLNTIIGSSIESGRNVIADNGYDGLLCGFGGMRIAGYCFIAGNNIGTDITGSVAFPNDQRNNPGGIGIVTGTVWLTPTDLDLVFFGAPGNTTPGGACTGFCNLVSGNNSPTLGLGGLYRSGFGQVIITNNFFGLNRSGTSALPNEGGVNIYYGSTIFGGPLDFGGPQPLDGGNVVSGNELKGLSMQALEPGGVYKIQGNLIGTSSDGLSGIGNGVEGSASWGILAYTAPTVAVTIGGPSLLERNVVADGRSDIISQGARGDGIVLNTYGYAAVFNNYVGLNRNGLPLGNSGNGISVSGDGESRIGGTAPFEANAVKNNGRAGVAVTQFEGGGGVTAARRATIRGNSIANNGRLGIDLANASFADPDPWGVTPNDCFDEDAGANDLQNFPELFAPTVNGNGTVSIPTVLRSAPARSYTIDYYSVGTGDPTNYGEGENYLGSAAVTTDGNGFASVTFTTPDPVPAGMYFTATATDPNGNTSEFSCLAGECTTGTFEQTVELAPEISCIQPIVVNIESDEDDPNTADGVCDVDLDAPDLQCSLRAAIQEANARNGYDVINFDIPGGGVRTITIPISNPLPTITEKLMINGSSQPGAVSSPMIDLRGEQNGTTIPAVGLRIMTSRVRVNQLAISHFGIGVAIGDSSGTPRTDDNTVENCYIGINADGMTFDPSVAGLAGVSILGNSRGNLVGGGTSYGGNVIGNYETGILIAGAGVESNIITNNKAGTNAAGNAAIPNVFGIVIGNGAKNNVVGGALGSDGNLISGNLATGVSLSSGARQNRIGGNLIGTDAGGNTALGNGSTGVNIIGGATQNQIGTGAADRNIISGNGGVPDPNIGYGIKIDSASPQNRIAGNYIGLGLDGSTRLRSRIGIGISSSNNTIGGSSGAGNVISNTDVAISLGTADANVVSSNVISHNRIGTNSDGNLVRSNLIGVLAQGQVTNTSIGSNTLSGNNVAGVLLRDGAYSNSVSENRIGTDSNGSNSVPNGIGIAISRSIDNTVRSNLVSGNTYVGVFLGEDFEQQGQNFAELLKGIGPPQSAELGTVQLTSGNIVQSNLIGTDPNGNQGNGNGISGINLGINAVDNQIGGRVSLRRGNTISGHQFGNSRYGIFLSPIFQTTSDKFPRQNKIQGNRIGLRGSVNAALANRNGIHAVQARDNLIGGDPANCVPNEPCDLNDLGNIIGGNLENGILLEGPDVSGNLVGYNFIGVAPDGTLVANGADGISLIGSTGNDIVGNTVGGNGGNGIFADNSSTPLSARRKVDPMKFGGGGWLGKVQGNLVGAFRNVDGTVRKAANALNGIKLVNVSGFLIGADDEGAAKNLVLGNGESGIRIEGAASTANRISNTIIGTDENGTAQLGNGSDGLRIDGAPDNVVGDPFGRTAMSNTIAGNGGDGVVIVGTGAEGNSLFGNAIGNVVTNSIRRALPNSGSGVAIKNAARNAIGNLQPILGNTISGNGLNGVLISGSRAIGNVVARNFIGTDQIGNQVGNLLHGIRLTLGANNNVIGGSDGAQSNTISSNGGSGILIDDELETPVAGNVGGPWPAFANSVFRNQIFGNGGLGIDIGAPGPSPNDDDDPDEGANRGQNYPEITGFQIDANGDLVVSYKVDSSPANSTYGTGGLLVEFYKADLTSEGAVNIGTDRYTVADHDSSVAGTKTVNLGNAAALGFTASDRVTATATDAEGNSSEFFPALSPTAAGITVGGTVRDRLGNPLARVAVSLTPQDGVQRTVLTNQFGRYEFADVSVGETVVVSVSHSRYRFERATVLLTPDDNVADADFTGEEIP